MIVDVGSGEPVNARIQLIGQKVRRYLEQRYGPALRDVLLYGSHVRGTAGERSDVDLLVVVSDVLDPWQVHRSLDELLFNILLETGELVSVVVVPETHYQRYHSPFLINVRREGVSV